MGVPIGVAGDSRQTRSEEIRIEFLDGELDISQTFLDVAEIEIDDPERCAVAKKERPAWVRYGSNLDRLSSGCRCTGALECEARSFEGAAEGALLLRQRQTRVWVPIPICQVSPGF